METLALGSRFQFIRIGNIFMNPSQITSVFIDGDTLEVYFFEAEGEVVLRFNGEEKDAFMTWLEKEALDITPMKAMTADDPGF